MTKKSRSISNDLYSNDENPIKPNRTRDDVSYCDRRWISGNLAFAMESILLNFQWEERHDQNWKATITIKIKISRGLVRLTRLSLPRRSYSLEF